MSARAKKLVPIVALFGMIWPWSAPTGAQTAPLGSVFEENLGQAQAYDSGLVDYGQGGLAPTLWQGTSELLAIEVINSAPSRSSSPAVTDMVKGVLLSGGTPPIGAESSADGGSEYVSARFSKLMAMGLSDQATQLLSRQPQYASSLTGRQINASLALLSGQTSQACGIADENETGRSEPYWAKLRAFCHVTRDEVAAAELTADLLRRNGHEDEAFFSALRQMTGLGGDPIGSTQDPLLLAMSNYIAGRQDGESSEAEPSLQSFIADAPNLTPDMFDQRLTALSLIDAPSEEENPGGYFDFEQTLHDQAPSSWGKLDGIIKTSSDAGITARIASELLGRASQNGIFNPMAAHLEPYLTVVPPGLAADFGAESFARYFVYQGELGNVRGLYDGVPADDELKTRLALASDALGNGFMLGTLGSNMTERLNAPGGSQEQQRAIRDAFIAVGLGARLSDEAALVLGNYRSAMPGRSVSAGSLLVLKAAADRGSQAETALRAASVLGEGGPQSLRADQFAIVLEALIAAGLQEQAGRLAAEDFIGQ